MDQSFPPEAARAIFGW